MTSIVVSSCTTTTFPSGHADPIVDPDATAAAIADSDSSFLLCCQILFFNFIYRI